MEPLLDIDFDPSLGQVAVGRTQGIPDGFWLQVIANWGGDRDFGGRVLIRVEDFLSRLSWLGASCRLWSVGIEWSESAEALLLAANSRKSELQTLLCREDSPLEFDDSVLRGSRFTGMLRQFQRRDLAKLLSLPHGANFSVPGAGKTLVTYCLYEIERIRTRVNRLMVVGPMSAFEAWAEEAESWLSPTPVVCVFEGSIPADAEVLVVNYQRLNPAYDELANWTSAMDTHIVIDEAHRIKRGWAGQWGTACLRLAYLAERRDVLTGTPTPNHPRDLASLLDFLWPGQADSVLPRSALLAEPPPEAITEAGRVMAPLFVRTTKAELELPEPTIHSHEIPLAGLQREIYLALMAQYQGMHAVTERESLEFSRMGRIVMYLLEAATNPALLGSGSSLDDPASFKHPPIDIPVDSRLASLLAEYGRYETPPKFVALAQLLETNRQDGRKTLVWSNFVRNLELLHQRVLSGLQPAIIHGGITPHADPPVRSRKAELDRFRHDPDCWVLLANPAAMAEGVSLHYACNDAIYVDRTFNAGQYLQSLDRIHRLGLGPEIETNVTLLTTSDTIDDVVSDRLRLKTERMQTILDDPDLVRLALPDEDEAGSVLDEHEDLEALFRHLRGE